MLGENRAFSKAGGQVSVLTIYTFAVNRINQPVPQNHPFFACARQASVSPHFLNFFKGVFLSAFPRPPFCQKDSFLRGLCVLLWQNILSILFILSQFSPPVFAFI